MVFKSKNLIPSGIPTTEQPKKKFKSKFRLAFRRKKVLENNPQELLEVQEVAPKTEVLIFQNAPRMNEGISENLTNIEKFGEVHKESVKHTNKADKREWFRFNKMFYSTKDVSMDIDFETGLGELLIRMFIYFCFVFY